MVGMDAAGEGQGAAEGRALLVDGHSLAFRAFFALPGLTASGGQETGALHGFLTMLLRLVREEHPRYLAVAFDRGRPSFRTDKLPSYKAQRQEAPRSFHQQLEILRELLPHLGCTVVEAEGYEGDDVLGTLSRSLGQAGVDVVILSGDRDLLQLVGPHVAVVVPRKGISDVTRWTAKEVEAAYGIPPWRLPEFKALAGDASDNLPGVPGIGEKTARELLTQVSSLEELLSQPPSHLRPRVREALLAHAASVFDQRDVATIRTDVPLPWDLGQLVFVPRLDARAQEILQHLEMRSVLSRWPGGDVRERPVKAPHPQPPFPGKPEPGTTARPWAGLAALVQGKGGQRRLGYLTLWVHGTAYRVGEARGAEALPQAVRAALEDPHLAKVGVHLKELCAWCLAQGVRVHGPLLDLEVAGYLLEPGRSSYPPSFLAGRLGLEEQLGPWPSDPQAQAAWYAQAAAPVEAALKADGLWDLYQEVEGPLIPVLAAMEEAGIRVDPAVLLEVGQDFSGRISQLEAHIHRLAGQPFNVNSPRQLSDVLFGRLGIAPPRRTRTKTGAYSTDQEVLLELAPLYEIARYVLDYRQLVKLRSTYVDALLPLIGPDGRVHTTFHQTVAATGRLSSSDPNLQNIPVRQEEGRRIRSAFVAEPGRLLLCADYSQVELRILAHLSQDPSLLAAFRSGLDVHTQTASKVFGVPPQEVTPEMRRRAKAVNFGIVYGMSDYGLSRDLGISVGEAHAFIEAYFRLYPGVRAYLEQAVERARETGYTLTVMGRRRYLADLRDRRPQRRSMAERQAMNAPIQGTAADIIKRAMVQVAQERLPGQLLLQVHDELIFEVPRDQVDDLAQKVRRILEGAFALAVPLTVEVKVGEDWARAQAYDPQAKGGAHA
jgi:DNA polymerase-1